MVLLRGREWVPKGFSHGFMVESLGISITEVNVGLEDQRLSSESVLADLEQLVGMVLQHGLSRALVPAEVRMVEGRLADVGEKGRVVVECGGTGKTRQEAILIVVLNIF
jgi:molybdopterin biosynthesis enzyme MoaB